MKYFFLFLFYFRGSKKDEFTYNLVTIASFSKYLCSYNTKDFLTNDNNLIHIIYWMSIRKGVISKKLMNFLESSNHLLHFQCFNKKEVDFLKEVTAQINYDGVEYFQNKFNNNKLFIYNLAPIDKKIYDSCKNIEYSNNFPIENIYHREKSLLYYCKYCNKKEINSILKTMAIEESKIVYLESRERYVYIKLKKIVDFPSINFEELKYFYLQNGLSLLKHNKKVQEEYFLKLIHNKFCK